MAETIVSYLIDQANLNDIRNMQFEKDLIFLINREVSNVNNNVINTINDNAYTLLQVNQLSTRVQDRYTVFLRNVKRILNDKFIEYYRVAYDQTRDLIDLGREVSGRLSEQVTELGNIEYDEETIKFLRDHAFELLQSYSAQQVMRIRSAIGDLFLKGKANKVTIRDTIQKILDTNKSKAEEITQTELSRAYNYGTLARLYNYQNMSGQRVRKYWYGFKFSAITCDYCRPRIGNVYDLEDESEMLPAHVRCRCVWLPILDGWDEPIKTDLISRANMLNTAYSEEMIYNRINSRLGINYGEYIDSDAATKYMAGDRSESTMSAIEYARKSYIMDIRSKFGISMDTANTYMSSEFNTQMKFWQEYVSGSIADNNKDNLNRAYEAIKSVTILPWNASQLSKWNSLLSTINLYR